MEAEAATYWLAWVRFGQLIAVSLVAIGVVAEFAGEYLSRSLERPIEAAREERLARLTAETEASRAGIADANARAAEANQKIAEAQLELAKFRAPRRNILSPNIRPLVESLSRFSGTKFDTGLGMGDGEQANFVWDLEAALTAAGWTQVSWMVSNVGEAAQVIQRTDRPISGSVSAENVEIYLGNVDPQLRRDLLPATEALISGLKRIGIEANEVPFNTHSVTPVIHILIGPKR